MQFPTIWGFMNIHHFAYLFGTDEQLIKGELLVLMLSGNLDIINKCLCFNTCALTTHHLLVSMQCDLWPRLQDPKDFLWLPTSGVYALQCAPQCWGLICPWATRDPKVTRVDPAAETQLS